MEPVVLIAHGSRDPRAASSTRALVRAVAAARPGLDVRAAFLDHTAPTAPQVLGALNAAGQPAVTVVPLLLTAAYHGRVDIPEVLAGARAAGLCGQVRLADVLGPVAGRVPGQLLAGLRRRLAEAGTGLDRVVPGAAGTGLDRVVPGAAGTGFDGVVLAAAGTRDAAARDTVAQVAAELGAELGAPARVAYASAAGPTGGEAVALLRRRGARRVAVAAYFLAPGRLYDTIAADARSAGAVAVAQPLGGAVEIARLVLDRIGKATPGAPERRADGGPVPGTLSRNRPAPGA